jgi:hypothetical protein
MEKNLYEKDYYLWLDKTINRRFKSEVHHLKSLTEESSSVKVGY